MTVAVMIEWILTEWEFIPYSVATDLRVFVPSCLGVEKEEPPSAAPAKSLAKTAFYPSRPPEPIIPCLRECRIDETKWRVTVV